MTTPAISVSRMLLPAEAIRPSLPRRTAAPPEGIGTSQAETRGAPKAHRDAPQDSSPTQGPAERTPGRADPRTGSRANRQKPPEGESHVPEDSESRENAGLTPQARQRSRVRNRAQADMRVAQTVEALPAVSFEDLIERFTRQTEGEHVVSAVETDATVPSPAALEAFSDEEAPTGALVASAPYEAPLVIPVEPTGEPTRDSVPASAASVPALREQTPAATPPRPVAPEVNVETPEVPAGPGDIAVAETVVDSSVAPPAAPSPEPGEGASLPSPPAAVGEESTQTAPRPSQVPSSQRSEPEALVIQAPEAPTAQAISPETVSLPPVPQPAAQTASQVRSEQGRAGEVPETPARTGESAQVAAEAAAEARIEPVVRPRGPAAPQDAVEEAAPVVAADGPFAAGPRPAEAAPALESASAARVSPVEQVVERIRLAGARSGDQVVVNLEPPELGRVRLTLAADGQQVRGVVEVDNPRTLVELQREAEALTQRLADEGVELRQLDFQLSDQGRGGSSGAAFDQAAGGGPQPEEHGASQRDSDERGSETGSPVLAGDADGEEAGGHVADGSINVWM